MQNQLDLISIGEAADYLNVSIDTLRRWEKKGKIEPLRSPGGHRYYSKKDLRYLFGKKYERAAETKPRKKREEFDEEILLPSDDKILEREVREVKIPQNTPLKIIREEIIGEGIRENFIPSILNPPSLNHSTNSVDMKIKTESFKEW